MTWMPCCSDSGFSSFLPDKFPPARPRLDATDSFWHSNDAEQPATGLGVRRAGCFVETANSIYCINCGKQKKEMRRSKAASVAVPGD